MDDVESQFCEGMRPIVSSKVGAALDHAQMTALLLAGIRAFRVGFDRPWEIKYGDYSMNYGEMYDELTANYELAYFARATGTGSRAAGTRARRTTSTRCSARRRTSRAASA